VASGEIAAGTVVDILDENRLLPYIIGDTANMALVASGQMTSASKIGDIIVSEECIKGTYQLCLSFLKFVSTILKSPDYVDTTRTMLASLTYIANEIYPNHQIWTYREIADMYHILRLCTEIFYQVVVAASSKDERLEVSLCAADHTEERNQKAKSMISDLKVVCILSLSEGQAHRQLLDVIVEGKQAIEKIKTNTDPIREQAVRESEIVDYVRHSLSIFDNLLLCCDHYKTDMNLNGAKHPSKDNNDQSTTMTCIEKALFDTSIRPGLLQRLFGYVYQKEDTKTACIAADLVKTIARKFSMSLMACLGSEADKVCEFFITCLDSKESRTDLQIAIMDLLSTCVRHQPGLIELFLNFRRDQTSEGDHSANNRKHFETLKVIKDLLEHCSERQSNDSTKSLHTHVMNFVLTFWQKCHSAIEQFDTVDDFWDLISRPLMHFVETDMSELIGTANVYDTNKAQNDKLYSYALMIIARELFNTSSGITERKLNPKLRARLDDLNAKKLLSIYSTFIVKRYSGLNSNLDKSKDYNRLMSAWRDFLTSYSKFKPFEVNQQVKNQIVSDLLACLTIELRLVENLDRERVAFIGETLLMIWPKWIGSESASDDLFRFIHELLYLVDVAKEHLPFSFLLTFQTTLNIYLLRSRDYLLQSKRSFDLLVPALQVMQFSLKIMEKFSSNVDSRYYKPGIESRLCQASITTLRFIIDVARPHVEIWISYLKTNLKTDALIQFLALLVKKRIGTEVCLSLVELLLCLASIQQTSDYLNKSDLLSQVNMIAVSAYEQPYVHLSQLAYNSNHKETATAMASASVSTNITSAPSTTTVAPITPSMVQESNILDWLPIYQLVLRLNIEMILTLGNEYTSTAVEFISIHSIRICELIEQLRTINKDDQHRGQEADCGGGWSKKLNMDEVLQTVYLINQVLRRGIYMWKRRNRQSYQAISNEISKAASTLGSHLAGNLSSSPDNYTLAVAFCCSSCSLIRQFDAKDSTKTKWQQQQQQ